MLNFEPKNESANRKREKERERGSKLGFEKSRLKKKKNNNRIR